MPVEDRYKEFYNYLFYFSTAASKRQACSAAAAKAKRNNKRSTSETALMNENAGYKCKQKQQQEAEKNKQTHTRAASANANANCKFQLERALARSLIKTPIYLPHSHPFVPMSGRTYFVAAAVCLRERNVLSALSVCVFYVVIAFHDTNSNGLPLRTA